MNKPNKLNKLSLDLQYFAEDDPQGREGEGKPDNQQQQDKTPSKDQKQQHMIPKSRFDEVNNSYKTVKEQLDQLLAEKEESERQAKEKQGEYQTLYEEVNQKLENYKTNYETTENRVKELESVMNSMLETKMEKIPESYRDLIPDHLSVEQKLDWISKAETKGLFKKQTTTPVGGSTNPPTPKAELEGLNPFQLLKAGYGQK